MGRLRSDEAETLASGDDTVDTASMKTNLQEHTQKVL